MHAPLTGHKKKKIYEKKCNLSQKTTKIANFSGSGACTKIKINFVAIHIVHAPKRYFQDLVHAR